MINNLDIDRAQQEQETENRQPETFDEISKYLLSKKNCRVNGKGFSVLDLHKYVKIAVETVELMPLKQRKTHIITKTTKRTMIKVYNSYISGNIENIN